jgi:excisionase family DNA binding protein
MGHYLSLKTVTGRLGVSDDTLRRWIRSRLFPSPIKIGGRVLFQEAVLVWFETERALTP